MSCTQWIHARFQIKPFRRVTRHSQPQNGNATFVGHSTLTKCFVVCIYDWLFINNCILSRANIVGIQFEHSGTFEPLMAEGKYVRWAPPESLKLSRGIPAISAIISSPFTQCYCVLWPRLLPGSKQGRSTMYSTTVVQQTIRYDTPTRVLLLLSR